jgi:signal transduction histidine kinase
MGGSGTLLAGMPALKSIGVTKFAIFLPQSGQAGALKAFAAPIIKAEGMELVDIIEIPPTAVEFSQFVLTAQNAGAQGAELGLPVVFLTVHDDDATLRAASVTEAFGYIIKPAQDRELRIVIEMALYKHAAEHQRRSLEQQLRRSEKLDAIGQLAGGIAHDFNNVLMAILGTCRSLSLQLPSGERPHRQVSAIQEAAERAAAMTRRLLAFARGDHDEPIPLDLAAHIHRMSALLVDLLSDNISVVISLAPGLHAVVGRSSEIEQVIMNLVVNARDAMPGGGTVTIAACNVPETNEVLLTVTDTGTGMDAATRRRIFEPFFTTKAPGAGTGLGLATVYAVVTRSRGRIDVTSELGAGTTFSIWLPATRTVPAEPSPERVEPMPALEGTIVVVEDDAQVRVAICDILEEAGLHVIEACDGLEALHACRGHAGATTGGILPRGIREASRSVRNRRRAANGSASPPRLTRQEFGIDFGS